MKVKFVTVVATDGTATHQVRCRTHGVLVTTGDPERAMDIWRVHRRIHRAIVVAYLETVLCASGVGLAIGSLTVSLLWMAGVIR